GAPAARSSAAVLSQAGVTQSAITRPIALTAPLAVARPDQLEIVNSLARQKAVKISVKRERLYRVVGDDLVAAGLDPKAKPEKLQLYADGTQVPIDVTTDQQGHVAAVEFYGIGLDTAATDTRVYLLIAGSENGLRIAKVKGDGIANNA